MAQSAEIQHQAQRIIAQQARDDVGSGQREVMAEDEYSRAPAERRVVAFRVENADAVVELDQLLGDQTGDDAFSAVRVGAMVAAAAVVVFVTSSTMTEQGPTAELGTSPVTVASTRTPGGRTRPVRIDAMEVAEGHTVSTWMRPKTKTRVIWVAASSPADGFSANPASMDR
jgi:hypothetical protein